MIVIAWLVFFLVAILAWVDKTISVEHLIALTAVGLFFVAGHLAFRTWWPDRRW